MSLYSVSVIEDLTDVDFEKLVIVVLRQGLLQSRAESHGECVVCVKGTRHEFGGSKVAKAEDRGHKEIIMRSNRLTKASIIPAYLVLCKRLIGEVMCKSYHDLDLSKAARNLKNLADVFHLSQNYEQACGIAGGRV
jgi:hypothetical protein